MAHAKGSNPSASDFNSFVGSNNVATAYASSAAATQKVAALLGVGYGDRGYGQTSPVLAAIAAGTPILAASWLDLRNAIATMCSHQGTATTLLPRATDYAAGMPVKAATPASSSYDLATLIRNVDSNRFNTNGGASLSLTRAALTVTRATTWGSGSTGITTVVNATFASEDAARYFFNSGGALTIVLAHTATTTVQDQNWNTILSALGTISIGARSSARSGSGGTLSSAIGFYELTTANATILSGAIGTGSYTANTITVSAAIANKAGVNGGNGTTVVIKIVLTDGHTNSFSDSVSAGTNAKFGYKKASVVLAGIPNPTYSTVTNF